jgi:hypothetical protein
LEVQRLEAPSIPQAAPLESRSIAEQQAVLNLLAFAGQDPQAQGVETVINTLLVSFLDLFRFLDFGFMRRVS